LEDDRDACLSSIAALQVKQIEDKAEKVEMYLLVESEQAFTAFVRKNITMTGFTVLSTLVYLSFLY
jgi:hypothetical protein